MRILQRTRLIRKSSLALILVLLLLGIPVSASVPYTSYVYDKDKQAIEAPDAYVVENVLDGISLGVGSLNSPQDIFKDGNGTIYVVDTGNNRIISWNKESLNAKEFKSFPNGEKTETLSAPQNIFVDGKGDMYISDTGNKRVLVCDHQGNTKRILTKPQSDLFGEKTEFKPHDLVATSAGTIYVLAEGVYQGAVTFNAEGEFSGYYGSNKVQADLGLLTDYFWKSFMTAKQRSRMRRYVPIQYSSIHLDSQDFIYLTTESSTNFSERIRKLNPLGQNILRSANNTAIFFGDPSSFVSRGETNATTFTSLDVIDDKYITVLDRNRMRIFQYNQECDLLTIFGCNGTLKGAFVEPVGVCGYGNNIFVLDAQKNSITVFELTAYGKTLHTAIDIYTDGRYQESLPYWYEVLKYNSSSLLANRGVGKALYQVGKSKEAMAYFEKCNNKTDYSFAYSDYRRTSIRANFAYMVVTIVVIVLMILFIPRIFKKVRGGSKK